MKICRKVLCPALVLILIASLAVTAGALPETGAEQPGLEEGAGPAGPEEGSAGPTGPEEDGAGPAGPEEDGIGPAAEETEALLDPQKLEELVGAFREERGLTEENFSVAYCYTGTGEAWSWNGDLYFPGASLYKLSLMMGLARKVSSGELSQDDEIYGMDISYIEKMSLTYSQNEISEMMIGYFGPFREYRLMQAEIAGVPEEELPEEYFSNNIFSADFMLGVLETLYQDPDTYPNVIDCLLEAQPEHYFRLRLEGQYDVAQKYGGGDHYLHTAGIVYTPTPCLVVVMTYYVSNAEAVIGDLAQMLADYSLTLDQRAAQREAQREEEARLQAEAEEAARLEEQARREEEARQKEQARREEQARLEEERQAREELQQLAQQTQEEARTQDGLIMERVLFALVIVLFLLLVVYFCGKLRRRRGS